MATLSLCEVIKKLEERNKRGRKESCSTCIRPKGRKEKNKRKEEKKKKTERKKRRKEKKGGIEEGFSFILLYLFCLYFVILKGKYIKKKEEEETKKKRNKKSGYFSILFCFGLFFSVRAHEILQNPFHRAHEDLA